MKELWKNGVVVLLVIGVLYIIFLRECKHPLPCIAKDEMIIKKSIWDSIQVLANKPPIVKIDTHYIKGDIVYVPTTPLPPPKPEPKDSTINNYADSLFRKDIQVWYNFKVRGTLLDRSWRYLPIQISILEQKTVFVPHFIDRPVKTPANGLFVNGLAGGNEKSFLFGGGADFITKKGTEIGYQYQRFGTDNFHSVKVGVRLFPR